MSKLTAAKILSVAALMLLVGGAKPLAAAGQDDAVKKGAQVYAAQKCQTCHSIAGKGGKANPLDGVGKKLSADDIKAWIVTPTEMTKKSGSTKKPPMPNKYSKLPAADIDAMVAYLASLK
jgi:mono/diheme cytochrome c family protein